MHLHLRYSSFTFKVNGLWWEKEVRMVKKEMTLFCIYKKIMETLDHLRVPSHFHCRKINLFSTEATAIMNQFSCCSNGTGNRCKTKCRWRGLQQLLDGSRNWFQLGYLIPWGLGFIRWWRWCQNAHFVHCPSLTTQWHVPACGYTGERGNPSKIPLKHTFVMGAKLISKHVFL